MKVFSQGKERKTKQCFKSSISEGRKGNSMTEGSDPR